MSEMRIKLTYTAVEYGELKGRLDKAINDLARHGQELVELKEERAMLLQQIERAVDEQKVELPRKVAEAIEWFRAQNLSNEEIYEISLDPADGKYGARLHYWRDGGAGDGDLLMHALVNGYTIEIEPREKVKQFLEKWYTSPCGDDQDAELYELSDGIIEMLRTSS